MKNRMVGLKSLFSIVLLCMVTVHVPVFAQQQISGSQSGTLGPGEYTVSGNITVGSGNTLTIKPGTKFFHSGGYSWSISGTLMAQGSADDSIYFTRKGSTTWKGISFTSNAPAAILDYCVVEYINGSSAIFSNASKGLTISHSRVSNCVNGNYGGTIKGYKTALLVDHCLINNNKTIGHPKGNGVCVDRCTDAKILNTVFVNNSNTDNGS